MLVRFSRVNEDDNSFDQILVVDDVSIDGFEAARKFEAAADEPEDVVADLYDDRGIRDTMCLTRQRMALAAVAMKQR